MQASEDYKRQPDNGAACLTVLGHFAKSFHDEIVAEKPFADVTQALDPS